MSEDPGRQRYCGNCGTELRAGTSFCVSCGAPLTSGTEDPGSSFPESEARGRLLSFLDDLRRGLRQTADGLGGVFSGLRMDGIQRLPTRPLQWFRDLPSIPKLVIVGLVTLVLLVLLSPVAVIVAAVLFAVSIIALIIRVAQKGSLKNWGMVAVASVILIFTFGFMSDALYGTGFMGSPGSGSQESSGTPGGSDRSRGETDVAYDVVSEVVDNDGRPLYYVVSSANDLESLNLVAQDIQQQLLQTGEASVNFFKSQADVPPGGGYNDLLGMASIYQDDSWIRIHYSEDYLSLSSEEVDQVIETIADNGYVVTTVNGGEHLPIMPDFMYEERDPASATATASASATPSARDGSYAEGMDRQEANCRLRFYLVTGGRSEDGDALAKEIFNYADSHGILLMSAMDELGYPRYSGCEA